MKGKGTEEGHVHEIVGAEGMKEGPPTLGREGVGGLTGILRDKVR